MSCWTGAPRDPFPNRESSTVEDNADESLFLEDNIGSEYASDQSGEENEEEARETVEPEQSQSENSSEEDSDPDSDSNFDSNFDSDLNSDSDSEDDEGEDNPFFYRDCPTNLGMLDLYCKTISEEIP